ncbi:unnamed protein product, partial [Candidula unifasciata]
AEYDEIQRATKERADIVAKYDLGREEGAQIDPWEDPAFEVYHVTDRYGFIHDKALPKSVDAAEEKSKQVERERTTKWLKMLKAWDKYYPGEKLTRRVYKGIPDCLRGEVWTKLLNIPKVKAEQEGIYQQMRNRARTKSTSIRQIDLDVNRTYRNHIMFRERYGVKQQALFHVLAAYSVYNTEIGYCQGMSEVAALLLMYLNEEDAFWGLSQLFISPRHNMHGFFMHGFPKLMRFQDHYDNVLRKFLPKVRKHLERNEMYPSLYTIKWFLQCFLDRTPFHLTLRLWDIHMLDGEQALIAMAYCIIKMHRRYIVKMQMDELLTFFQSRLESNFIYDNDVVIEQLQICMEELKKAKMAIPPKGKINEQPTLPFGLEIQPSVEELIGRRTDETVDEHFRKNIQRPGGKAAYLRRKNTSGSVTGGAHLLGTPEMSRSRGDTRSLHSRISQHSLDDKSSYYDTATNSRMSLTDYSAKTSAPSSRTSFGDNSEMGSMSALAHGLATSEDFDDVSIGVTTPTTPTNRSLPTSRYSSSPPLHGFEVSTSPTQARSRSASSSLEQQPHVSSLIIEPSPTVVYERSPRPGTLMHNATVPTSTSPYHSSPTTPTDSDYHRSIMKGSRSHDTEAHALEHKPPQHPASHKKQQPHTSKHTSTYELSSQHTTRFSESSDNINGVHSSSTTARLPRGPAVTYIPVSKSEGYVSSMHKAEIANGHVGHRSAKMKVTRTENDIHYADQPDRRKQNFHLQKEVQSEQLSSTAPRGQSKITHSRFIEKTSHL